jgi:hypothetical protein
MSARARIKEASKDKVVATLVAVRGCAPVELQSRFYANLLWLDRPRLVQITVKREISINTKDPVQTIRDLIADNLCITPERRKAGQDWFNQTQTDNRARPMAQFGHTRGRYRRKY